MVLKIINATEARVGTNLLLEGNSFTVKKMDISKTGKHGHAKCRIEAENMISGSKKVFVVPGHERFEVPLVTKSKGQILSLNEGNASIMDLESFETIEVLVPSDLKGQIEINDNVEYWNIEGDLIIKRKV
ncbi:translation initiation factor IF-5A [Candidatus Pacearchaeota archaeon CG10_big_fil_rev_8_21_14_0_10_32_42]|nr:MAG: translation initiation factor IF-5A [Candidatus Pacearchaeota archaeon CG10_big_fil_rev_8_21_14_0_10_32_42]